MDGLDSVEVAPSNTEGDSQSSHAAEEQLWRHEFFRDCLAPKQAAFKVNGSPCQHLPVHNPTILPSISSLQPALHPDAISSVVNKSLLAMANVSTRFLFRFGIIS